MLRRILLTALLVSTASIDAKTPAADPLATLKQNDQILQDMLRRFPKESISTNDSLKHHLSVMFGFGELGKRALGKSWVKQSKPDQDTFQLDFSKMVEKTALQSPQDYLSDSSKSVLSGKPNNEATIITTVYRGSSQVIITYKLYQDAGAWRVYDLKVGDKPSQVEKYRNQFTQYLAKKTFKELLATIKKNAGT